MLNKPLLLFCIAITLGACSKTGNSNCANQLCTANFAMVTVRFLDNNGEGVNVKNYSAVNQRTKDTIDFPPAAHVLFEKGTYTVASDNQVKTLPETGDDIKVSGTDSVTNVTKTAVIKVAGGKCACHVSKIAGPSEIHFD